MRFYTIAEVAELLSMSRATVIARIKDGTIGHVRVGRLIRVPESALEQLAAKSAKKSR